MVKYSVNCVYADRRDIDPIMLSNGQVLFDKREELYSVKNTLDLEEYLNYVDYLNTASKSNQNCRLSYLLDIGYIPLLIPPSFMIDTVMEWIPKITIPYISRDAVSFSKYNYQGDSIDIWVSKMDCADLLHCPPVDVTVRKVLEVLL